MTNFYKLDKVSKSYKSEDSNLYTRKEIIEWANEYNEWEDLGLELKDNVGLAIDVLGNYGEFVVEAH